MSSRKSRRTPRPTSRHPVARSVTERGRSIAALALLIMLAFGGGIVWHAKAAASLSPRQASVATPANTQSDQSSSDDVPAISQPTATTPDNATPPPRSNPKNETYLELDMSQGKGLFTAWRIEPSDRAVVIESGDHKKVGLIGELRQGDVINMKQGLTALVTKAEKYTDPQPAADGKADEDGNVAERVVGWSMHFTDTLLDLRTTNEDVITTPEHPFFVHGKGWVKAGALKPGNQLDTESPNKLVSVVSTQVVHKRQAVYNIDVENTHTFYVGKDNLLVHNGDCVPEIEQVGEYLSGKAPMQVTPGTTSLEGQYVDDLGRVQPWTANYDEYGRLIGRTDNNAANRVMGYDATHYHTYGYRGNPSGWGGQWQETGSHIPGVFTP
jgi:hypothetical protein